MFFAKIFLGVLLVTAQLCNSAHVIQTGQDCSINNGQIINLNWQACQGAQYDNLSVNIKPYTNPPHYYINRVGNAKIASICVKDQFSEFDLYLDKDDKYGNNQQRIYVRTDFDQAFIVIFSNSHNPDGTIKAPVPTFVPIRSAALTLNGKPAINQPILSSSSDENTSPYDVRPPNHNIDVVYC